MDFEYNEEQQLLADSVKRFIEKDYSFEARKKIVASDAGAIPEHPFLVYQIAGGAVRSATY